MEVCALYSTFGPFFFLVRRTEFPYLNQERKRYRQVRNSNLVFAYDSLAYLPTPWD